ncbi:MAG: hypothetical protein IE937_01080 [Gammaproteobacteria bacterium]|nr:hypothetical protein [Gammaproteobacteria bacterium]
MTFPLMPSSQVSIKSGRVEMTDNSLQSVTFNKADTERYIIIMLGGQQGSGYPIFTAPKVNSVSANALVNIHNTSYSDDQNLGIWYFHAPNAKQYVVDLLGQPYREYALVCVSGIDDPATTASVTPSKTLTIDKTSLVLGGAVWNSGSYPFNNLTTIATGDASTLSYADRVPAGSLDVSLTTIGTLCINQKVIIPYKYL